MRPNILFIMADDHGAGAISSYGSRINQTPNIDRLARSGMRFTGCFDVNALCAPSRATILTGRHSCSNGFYRNNDSFDGSQQTFPKLLQQAGYETAIIGKWHLSTQPTGFDHYSVLPGHGRYWDAPFKVTGEPWEDGSAGGREIPGYVTEVITDQAIEWISSRQDSARPFCLLVHHKAPHTPHEFPPDKADLFNAPFREPETLFDDYSTRPALADCTSPDSRLDMVTEDYCRRFGWSETDGPGRLSGGELRSWVYQRFMHGYLRLVATLDDSVGRLVDALEDTGEAENTIVLYTSDNGFFLGDHGLFNKQWMYEPSLRVPLIVRTPGSFPGRPGGVEDHIVTTLDFAPTFLDIAGAAIPSGLHGRSILPLLQDENPEDWRESFYYHYYGQYGVEPHYGMRTESEKLIHFYDHEPEPYWEYFDLAADSTELANRISDPCYANRVTEMRADIEGYRKRIGDS